MKTLTTRDGRTRKAEVEAALRRLEGAARVTDDLIRIKALGLGIGLDALVGFVPLLGDIAGTMVPLYMITEARRLGVPKRILVAMGALALFDLGLAVIPIAGNIADIFFKANRWSHTLLRRHLKKELARIGSRDAAVFIQNPGP